MTHSGFIRVSSNPRVSPQARTPGEAAGLLREMLRLPRHRFWSDDVSLASTRFVSIERVVGHAQVTEAHLLEIALRRAGRLATFDRGVTSLLSARERHEEAVVLIST